MGTKGTKDLQSTTMKVAVIILVFMALAVTGQCKDKEQKQFWKDVKGTFDQIDADKDGKVTTDELFNFAQKMEPEDVKAFCEELVDMLDYNGDGVIQMTDLKKIAKIIRKASPK